jgi:hypothetical protein
MTIVLFYNKDAFSPNSCCPDVERVKALRTRIFGLFMRVIQYTQSCVGFEVFTAMGMTSTIFWDITACSSLKVNLCFGGTCRLHLQGRRIIPAR